MLLIDFLVKSWTRIKVSWISTFCCKNVDQLPSLSWTQAIAIESLNGWQGNVRGILWQLASVLTVMLSPPLLWKQRSVNSAPSPQYHLLLLLPAALMAPTAIVMDHLSANQCLQPCLLQSLLLLGDSERDKFSTSKDHLFSPSPS